MARVHNLKQILETQELYVDVYLKGRSMLFHFIQEDLQVILSVENEFIKILTCLNLEMMLKLFSGPYLELGLLVFMTNLLIS